MSEWQPIETAPKDGRIIIAARFKGEGICWVRDALWVPAQTFAETNGGDEEDYDPAWVSMGDEDDPIYPTHWMPFPKTPS